MKSWLIVMACGAEGMTKTTGEPPQHALCPHHPGLVKPPARFLEKIAETRELTDVEERAALEWYANIEARRHGVERVDLREQPVGG